MTLFSRIPAITQSKTLPVISEADVDYLVDYEPTSYDHWIFNKGSSSGLTGVNSGKILTPQSAAPTYSGNYLSMTGTYGNGLLTDINDNTANPVRTVCCVFREPTAGVTAVHALFGTFDGVNGGLAFLNGNGASRGLNITYPSITSSVATGQLISSGSWYFAAVSIDFSSTPKSVRDLVGGGSGHSLSNNNNYSPPSRQIVLGNGYYTSGHSSNMDFAEFIVFPKALSSAELQAVYLRRKARMAKLGITVV